MSIRILTVLVLAGAAAAQPPGRGGPPDARFIGAQAGGPGQVVKGAPYSADAVTETAQVLPDGNKIRQSTTVRVYRDSEGRTRREHTQIRIGGMGEGAVPPMVFINDPVARVNLALNPRDRVATRTEVRKRDDDDRKGDRRFEPGGRRGTEGRPNLKSEPLGQKVIDGVTVQGRRTTMTIPAGEIGNELPLHVVTETWYSPELRTVVQSRHVDPRSGETTFRLANLSRAEQPLSLFEVPADYKVSNDWRGGDNRRR